MKVVAGILTHRPLENGRIAFMKITYASLKKEADLVTFFNNRDASIGEGRNELMRRLYSAPRLDLSGEDVIVLSDDDVYWRPGWRRRVEALLRKQGSLCPRLVGGILEPEQGHNRISLRASLPFPHLIRDSTGGAAWAFRAGDWGTKVGPFQGSLSHGEDVRVCQDVVARGGVIAQAGLADHLGYNTSTWGYKEHSPPLDLRKWGLEDNVVLPRNEKDNLDAELTKLFRQRHAEIGLGFQRELYKLVRATKPAVVVETGVRTGVSTRYVLEAFEKNGAGLLYSCDPMYQDKRGALERFRTAEMGAPPGHEERWIFRGEPSQRALEAFPGPWDVFVHDSDPGAACLQDELRQALKKVRPGGWIVVNVYHGVGGTSVRHHVWEDFVREHKLEKDWEQVGDCAFLHLPAASVSDLAAEPQHLRADPEEEEEEDEEDPEDDEDDEDDEDEDEDFSALGLLVWRENLDTVDLPGHVGVDAAWEGIFKEVLDRRAALRRVNKSEHDLIYMPGDRVLVDGFPGESRIYRK